MGYSRPQITEDHIKQIRILIADNPGWHRTKLSQKLCEMWDWRGENGQIKDISCRDMLRSLEAAGKITLPAQLKKSRSNGTGDKIIMYQHDTTPVSRPLSEIMPLQVGTVTSKEKTALFKSYIHQYHYLSFDRSIGESLMYSIYSRHGTPLASLMFGASAWSCQPRDDFIGWDSKQRQANLRFTTNNSRFLVYLWIRVPLLASHTLALVCRRLSGDWAAKYGHPVYLLETYVECGRFRGTCYQAANWIRVGKTSGRGRNDRKNERALPEKDIYLFPLERQWRKRLLASQE
jgi:hypothetical protein